MIPRSFPLIIFYGTKDVQGHDNFMIFCNIWEGYMPEKNQRCVASFKRLMQIKDTYLMLPNSYYDQAIQEVENVDFWKIYSDRFIQFKADFVRFHYACIHPDLFYADTDVLFGKLFDTDFNKPMPYFGQWGCGAEHHLFYVNGACSYFKRMMKYIEQFDPKKIFLPILLQHFFRQNSYNRIDHETFSHQKTGRY